MNKHTKKLIAASWLGVLALSLEVWILLNWEKHSLEIIGTTLALLIGVGTLFTGWAVATITGEIPDGNK